MLAQRTPSHWRVGDKVGVEGNAQKYSAVHMCLVITRYCHIYQASYLVVVVQPGCITWTNVSKIKYFSVSLPVKCYNYT